MKQQLEDFQKELGLISSLKDLEDLRVKYLGRKGLITNLRKNTDFQSMTPEQRRNFGQEFNQLKTTVETAFTTTSATLKASGGATSDLSAKDFIDFSLPGQGRHVGALHPITQVQMELEDIFQGMGFMFHQGNEV